MREVHDLRASLEFTQKEFLDFKVYSKSWGDASKQTKNDMETVSTSLVTLSDKTDYIGGQYRRNNVITDGISESQRVKNDRILRTK